MDELQVLNDAKNKFELAKKRQDAALLQQIVEPLAEAIEELTSTLSEIKNIKPEVKPEPEYFDKDLSKNVIGAIDKVFNLIKNFKQSEIKIDLSPINSIAIEIKNQNSAIMAVLNKPNGQSAELSNLLKALVNSQNVLLEKWEKQIDYSPKIDSLISAINDNKNNDRVQELEIKYKQGGVIDKVVPIYKSK